MQAAFGSGLSNGWIGLSPIETLIQRACEPSLGEPPYNLHIELAEYINSKKANTYVFFYLFTVNLIGYALIGQEKQLMPSSE